MVGIQPDLSYTVLRMSQKNHSATIADLHNVNKVLRKVKVKESEMYYGRVGEKEELQIVGIGDASFKQDAKAVGGIKLLLVNKDFTKVSLKY